MNTPYRHDFEKWFSYFARIATNEIRVETGKGIMVFTPPRIISVSPLFYRSDNCFTACDKCCYFNYNFWAGCEPHPDVEEFGITVNDRYPVKYIFIEPHIKRACPGRTDKGCNIHEINPIHCHMPPMKFKQVKAKI